MFSNLFKKKTRVESIPRLTISLESFKVKIEFESGEIRYRNFSAYPSLDAKRDTLVEYIGRVKGYWLGDQLTYIPSKVKSAKIIVEPK